MKKVNSASFLAQSNFAKMEELLGIRTEIEPEVDYYELKAARMFNVPLEKVTPKMRSSAKYQYYFESYGCSKKKGE